MANPAFISSQTIAVSGNITIPAFTSMVVAVTKGASTPTLDTVAMSSQCTSAWRINTRYFPPVGTVAAVIAHTTRFLYFRYCGDARAGATAGHSATGVYELAAFATSATDMVVGFAYGDDANPANDELKEGAVAFTYVENFQIGYRAGSAATMDCHAIANGVGEHVDGGFVSLTYLAGGQVI